MDIRKRGKIDINELAAGLHKHGHRVSNTDLHVLMDIVSTVSSYEEFIYTLNCLCVF